MSSQELRLIRGRASPNRLATYGLLLGALLIVASALWVGGLRGQNLRTAWFSTKGISAWTDLAIGVAGGWLFSLAMWGAGQHLAGFEGIRHKIAQTLDLAALRPWHILALSLIAAAPEEIFFRGTLQPAIGWAAAAVIFGALHAITPLYFVYASAAGLALGYMANWRDSLWMPIAAHFAVDFLSLTLLARWSRRRFSAGPLAESIYEVEYQDEYDEQREML